MHIRPTEKELLFCDAANYIALHERSTGGAGSHATIEEDMSLKSISNWIGAWKRYRVAIRELESLSDRELADLGIARGEIELVARQSAGI